MSNTTPKTYSKSSLNNVSPRTKELFDSSIKRTNHFQQNSNPPSQMARANKSSRIMASNKQIRLIENIVGNAKEINKAKLFLILKKFNITYVDDVDEGPRPVFWKICDYCRINNNQNEEEDEEEEAEEIYDAVKLKELLQKAASGEKVTGLAAQIKPSVSSALSNMPIDLVYILSRSNEDNNNNNNTNNSSLTTPKKSPKKKKKGSPKLKLTISPSQSNKNSPVRAKAQAQKGANDSDNNQSDVALGNEDNGNTPKSRSKKRVTGAKYLPSFYDNLETIRLPY
ncbi:hypothetical protein M9Y10_035484 [Tritrichomonas musculus]|uniref:Uncharacterized protein n=1 Tax=Tritrichomonas musculus TaxID=1915356 RepID=A0ABR2KHT4_9EUKA